LLKKLKEKLNMYRKFENEKEYKECNLLSDFEFEDYNQVPANRNEILAMIELGVLKIGKGKKLIFKSSKYNHGYILGFLKDLCDEERLYFCENKLYIYDPENKYPEYYIYYDPEF
jgi:hypothetical protein